MKIIIGLVILLIVNHCVLAEKLLSENEFSEHLYKYMTKTQNEHDKTVLEEILEVFSFPQYVFRNSFEDLTPSRQSLTCVVCRSSMRTLERLLTEGSTENEIIELAVDLCTLLETQPDNICRGFVELNMPIILYIMKNKETFKAETFCGVVFQSNEKNTCPLEDSDFEWSIELPIKNVTYQPNIAGEDTFNIIQVSDLHYDPVYEAFGLAVCNEPTCCRKGQTEQASPKWNHRYNEYSSKIISKTEEGSFLINMKYANDVRSSKQKSEYEKNETIKTVPEHKQAGYWGDYRNCDAPLWAIEDCLDKIAENHKDIDYIYYTGDTADHGVWETTNELITESQRITVEKFRSTFGHIPVFPIMGNHEAQPANQYAPTFVTDPKLSSNWMYEMLAKTWSVWLPESATETIKLGGYYTVLLKPNFRVLALNSNMCHRFNWWLQMQPKDINGQLQWLVKTLEMAEMRNEKVHILSHIAAGRPDCLQIYTREYKRIVERFSDTITAEFNGHTHNDEFKVLYSKENINRPLFVAWNGGSVTANAYVNPNYKLYQINSQNYVHKFESDEVANFETWIFNLTEANLTPDKRPRWFKEYSFKEHYGMVSLSLEKMDNLLTRMVTTEKHLLQDFSRFKTKSINSNFCNKGCVQNLLRIMTTSELYDDKKSEALWELYNTLKLTKEIQ